MFKKGKKIVYKEGKKRKLSDNLVTYYDPKSAAAEGFRTLRTNISFAGVDNQLKVILFTSPSPMEGKSTTASNYAVTMAQMDKKVLLIDCDLRNPKLHKYFGINNDLGVSLIAVSKENEDNLLPGIVKKVSDIKNLYVLTSGVIPPNPAEILASKKMETLISKAKEEYDIIVIDTPPMGFLTDAVVLSKVADGVILVTAAGETNIDLAVHAKRSLVNVGANILGVVITKVGGNSDYRYYKRYKHYNYSAYGEDEEEAQEDIVINRAFSKRIMAKK